LLNDRVVHSLPLTQEDAREMVRSLRSSPLLFGYRGAPALDVAALEDVLLRVSLLAEQLPEIVEMDVNPVIVGADSVCAVDIAVRLAPWEAHPELAVRRLR
jgi:acyl-CoA synthetase (NDP forming)